ncbi:unnamed protein product [Pleuronectes platessa]|uniref:Uncharacterized protein n=1 Tax=Pleuronectes platessa TaxID=8262 RepID=A0A9N7V7L8_PLEPL|nr:unnamed protein product [Pleuronectes platessa]
MSSCDPSGWCLATGQKEVMGEEEDTHPDLKHFALLWPLPRHRSLSDTSGFRSRVMTRLRGARSEPLPISRIQCFSRDVILQRCPPLKLHAYAHFDKHCRHEMC